MADFSCGNGCVFGPSGKGGMQTNGGCVCSDRKLQRGVLHLRAVNDGLREAIERHIATYATDCDCDALRAALKECR
jgi:hypothetical protein